MSAQTQKTEVFGLDNDANVEDFMSRFSDPHTYVSPQEAIQRFNQLNQANHPELRNAVGSYVSQMDPESFTHAARNLDSNERTGFATRLVTQMYFPGDPLLEFDPIFNSIADDAARSSLISKFDWHTTTPEVALGFRFDIVLRGREATPLGSE